MRSIFKRFTNGFPLVALSLFCAATTISAHGQSRDLRVISARAGGVNFASGDVRVRFRDQRGWQALSAKDTLASGDTVVTGAASQLEVLLNPGSYFRLGENSEFTLADDSLDNLRLSLTKGSGLVEATGFNELRVSILVDTPHTRVEILRSGIYRIDVRQPDSTEVIVHKGRALIGKEQALTLKGGREARILSARVEVAKLDKNEKDGLDLWSRERAKLLAKANGQISARTVKTLLANADYVSPQYSMPRGLWYLNPRTGCYVFLPGGDGWSSPYGYHYNNSFFWGSGPFCNGCSRSRDYSGRSGIGTSTGGGTNTIGGGASGGAIGGGTRDVSSPAPQTRREHMPSIIERKSAPIDQ